MNRRFPRFFASLLTLVVCFAPFADAATTAPVAQSVLDQRNHFTASYGIYGGGFQALAIQIDYDFDKTHYSADMRAKPYGVLGRLLPWAGDYATKGVVKKGVLIPQQHDRISAWRDDKSHLVMTYKDGALDQLKEINDEKGKNTSQIITVPKDMSEDTVDLVTAVTDMLVQSTDKNDCSYAKEIYDGRRRFRMTFKDEGTQKLTKSAVNIFTGTAHLCRMELIPLKGFKGKPRGYYRIQEDARTNGGELPVVWLGRAWDGGPMIPVRMMVKSEYGTVLMHLQKIER